MKLVLLALFLFAGLYLSEGKRKQIRVTNPAKLDFCPGEHGVLVCGAQCSFEFDSYIAPKCVSESAESSRGDSGEGKGKRGRGKPKEKTCVCILDCGGNGDGDCPKGAESAEEEETTTPIPEEETTTPPATTEEMTTEEGETTTPTSSEEVKTGSSSEEKTTEKPSGKEGTGGKGGEANANSSSSSNANVNSSNKNSNSNANENNNNNENKQTQSVLVNVEDKDGGSDGSSDEDEEDVDCDVSRWTEWLPCTKTCGRGIKMRLRSVARNPQGDGKPCPELIDDEKCNLEDCTETEDCRVSAWQNVTPCSKTCGGGILTRVRAVTRPSSDGACEKRLIEQVQCNVEACRTNGPVHCQMTEWSLVVPCTKTCGGGIRTRVRSVRIPPKNNGEPCEGFVENKACNTDPCPSVGTDCEVTSWSSWSKCSVSCGEGIRTRARRVITRARNHGLSCPDLFKATECNGESCKTVVNCKLSRWSSWGRCACEGRVARRYKTRDVVQEPENGGRLCPVRDRDYERSRVCWNFSCDDDEDDCSSKKCRSRKSRKSSKKSKKSKKGKSHRGKGHRGKRAAAEENESSGE